MKRSAIAILALSCLAWIAQPAVGQKKSDPEKSAAAKADSKGAVFGIVKGMPSGTTFVLARPRVGPVTVETKGATIRNHGRFASFNDLKGGTFVKVIGPIEGGVLKATAVDIIRMLGQKGGKKPGKALAKPPAVPTSSATLPPPTKRP
jgi:hypothetical protein